MMHKTWRNTEKVPYCFSMPSNKFQGHTGRKIDYLNPISVRLQGRSQLSNPSVLPCFNRSINPWGHTRNSDTHISCYFMTIAIVYPKFWCEGFMTNLSFLVTAENWNPSDNRWWIGITTYIFPLTCFVFWGVAVVRLQVIWVTWNYLAFVFVR